MKGALYVGAGVQKRYFYSLTLQEDWICMGYQTYSNLQRCKKVSSLAWDSWGDGQGQLLPHSGAPIGALKPQPFVGEGT